LEEVLFLSFKTSSSALEGTTTLPFSGYRRSFPAIKRPEPEVDHSPPSNAEVENWWRVYSSYLLAWRERRKILRSGFRNGLKCEKW
jgi:hypothetical protein